MGEPTHGQSRVARRAAVPLAAAALFLILDPYVRLMLAAPDPLRGWMVGLLALLGVVASFGWLFVGTPVRDPDQLPPAAIPSMIEPALLVEATARGINRLGVRESTKDALIRWFVALVFAAILVGWDFYMQGIARR